MRQQRADLFVAAVTLAILLVGGIFSFQATQRPTTTMNGAMMDSMMDSGMTYGTDPIVYVLGALLVAVVIGGGYILIREDVTEATKATADRGSEHPDPEPASTPTEPGSGPDSETGSADSRTATPEPASGEESGSTTNSAPAGTQDLLNYLPADERRVLEPVLDSPGVTQIEIRDRSSFSKSKVSQTLSALEGRGLIYKEKQGRTFRVYPGDELDAQP